MVRVFVSYSPDATTEAARLDAWLCESTECDVFRFQTIPPGSQWPEEVELSLNVCDCLIVLLSRHAVESGNVFVEIQRSIAAGKPVVPIYVGVGPADIPISLAGLLHGITWTSWPKVEFDPNAFADAVL